MTDIELLPLPLHFSHQHDNVKKIVRNYAHDNVAHATEPLKAEIETLRAEVGTATRMHAITRGHLEAAEARANQLVEALRDIRDYDPVGGDAWLGAVELLQKKAHTALRDYDQEVRNE